MKKLCVVLIVGCLFQVASAQEYKANSKRSVEETLNESFCTGLFRSADGTILDVAANASASTYSHILDWVQGRVAGLQVQTTWTGTRIPIIRGAVPGIYVDEIPVAASYLNSLSVQDIAMVKVIKMPFYGGFNSGGGAVAIYTVRGSEEED